MCQTCNYIFKKLVSIPHKLIQLKRFKNLLDMILNSLPEKKAAGVFSIEEERVAIVWVNITANFLARLCQKIITFR